MRIPVFLSYPKPTLSRQQRFIECVREYMQKRGLEPRTLGITDYDMDAPLRAIRRLMLESNGIVTVAFRRTFVEKGASKFGSNIPGQKPRTIDGVWLTSVWPHIETAMAYQLGLPILIFREQGVLDEGILEKGLVGLYMPEFDLEHGQSDLESHLTEYFASDEWQGVMGKWEGYVRAVVERKGNPPQLY